MGPNFVKLAPVGRIETELSTKYFLNWLESISYLTSILKYANQTLIEDRSAVITQPHWQHDVHILVDVIRYSCYQVWDLEFVWHADWNIQTLMTIPRFIDESYQKFQINKKEIKWLPSGIQWSECYSNLILVALEALLLRVDVFCLSKSSIIFSELIFVSHIVC